MNKESLKNGVVKWGKSLIFITLCSVSVWFWGAALLAGYEYLFSDRYTSRNGARNAEEIGLFPDAYGDGEMAAQSGQVRVRFGSEICLDAEQGILLFPIFMVNENGGDKAEEVVNLMLYNASQQSRALVFDTPQQIIGYQPHYTPWGGVVAITTQSIDVEEGIKFDSLHFYHVDRGERVSFAPPVWSRVATLQLLDTYLKEWQERYPSWGENNHTTHFLKLAFAPLQGHETLIYLYQVERGEITPYCTNEWLMEVNESLK